MIRSTTHCLLMLAPALLAASLAAAAGDAPAIPAEVEFNRDIRPILSDRCFACHGPDKSHRKADLRLDTQEGLLSKVDDHFIIVPGKPEASELWKRIITSDEDDRMPPAKVGTSALKPLSERERALIKRWIEQGAKYEGHWAYIAPVQRVPPQVKAVHSRPVNPIDHFILAKLEIAGLTPSPDADRRTLIRRLSFDLTGLPPTPKEVEAFVNDKSPDAYEKLVDRLLADKHFGERMAVYWLDVVRYADSAGYHSDNDRSVWMYRDYVIDAFNSNKRFDTFTREQIAGDLLPGAGREQRVASGYNRLLNTTEEGGAQAKEYTAKYASDRVRNVALTWLGATMNCCECHDHKYDPLATREFYSMAAFFADVSETPVGRQQQTPIPTPQIEAELAKLDAQVAEAEKNLANVPGLVEAQKAWEVELAEKVKGSTRNDLAWIDGQKTPDGANRDGAFNFIEKDQGPTREGRHSRKQQADALIQHFFIGAKDVITLGKDDVLYAYIYLDPKAAPEQIMLQFNDGSWEHRAWWGKDLIPYGTVGTNGPNHRKMGPLPKTGEWVRLEVKPAEVGLKPGSKINGIAFTQWGGLAYWDQAGVNRDGVGLPDAVVQALRVPAGQRNAKQGETIAAAYREISPLLKAKRDEVKALQAKKEQMSKSMPSTLVTMATSPRTIRILKRGNWLDDSGEIVQPQVPAIFGKLDPPADGKRLNRLDLANWLVSGQNPVVARVFVNRLWKLFHGQGIVKSLEEFGSQGEWPTHPQLLDWLALEFEKSGWDVKHMVRLMVTSGTYRQSSIATADHKKMDPFNNYLARQGRFRLDAEFIRDNALTASGLLVDKLGGPSVRPYQPAGYWQHLNFPKREWQNDKGEGLYRRSLYTWWQRSFLHPALLAFDASSREDGVCARPQSNTPLQGLTLLNDPTYVEAARVLAEKIIAEGGAAAQERVAYAFQRVLQRPPLPQESKLLSDLVSKHKAEFAAEKAAVDALLKVGDKPAAANVDAAELAAWTSVARVLLNLHETITRE